MLSDKQIASDNNQVVSELESDSLSRFVGIENFTDRKSYEFGSGVEVSAFDVPVNRSSFVLADSDIHLNFPGHDDSIPYYLYHYLQNKAINSINDIICIICKRSVVSC